MIFLPLPFSSLQDELSIVAENLINEKYITKVFYTEDHRSKITYVNKLILFVHNVMNPNRISNCSRHNQHKGK